MFGTVSRGGAPGCHIPGLQPSGMPPTPTTTRTTVRHSTSSALPVPTPHHRRSPDHTGPKAPGFPPHSPSPLRVFVSSCLRVSKTPPQPESSTTRLLRPFRACAMFGIIFRGGAPGCLIPGLQPSGNKAPSASAPHRPRQHHIIRIADPHTAPPSIPRPHRPQSPRIPLPPSCLRVFV